MDQINTTQETEIKSSLHTVTPLSKYLALTLFVLMPFVGGWIGYTYAPTKVLEVEKIVIKEVPAETPIEKQNTNVNETETVIPVVDSKTVKIGDTFGNFTVTEAYYNAEQESYSIGFSGNVIVSGTIYPAEMLGPGIRIDEASALKLPSIQHGGELQKASNIELTGPLVETSIPKEALVYSENYKPYHITAEIKNYNALRLPKESSPNAELVRIIEVRKGE
jgi:hypothetical protein